MEGYVMIEVFFSGKASVFIILAPAFSSLDLKSDEYLPFYNLICSFSSKTKKVGGKDVYRIEGMKAELITDIFKSIITVQDEEFSDIYRTKIFDIIRKKDYDSLKEFIRLNKFINKLENKKEKRWLRVS
jgi:hypothetical protein